MCYRTFFVPAFAVLCSLSSARAAEFVSSEGFKLTYPENWKSASKDELARSVTSDPGIVACISGSQSENFTPTIKVIIPTPRAMLVPKTEKQTLQEIKDGLATPGTMTVPRIKTSHIHINGHAAYSIAYEKDDPASKKALRVWTVMLAAKNGVCIVTCTALKSQWGEAGPIFKSAINNLKFDGPPAK